MVNKLKFKIFFIWLIGGLGTLMFLLATAPWGVCIHSDTLGYICVAKYFSTGHVSSIYGVLVSNLTTYNLPFFPFCISVMDRWGINLFDGMRWFNAALFGLNIVLVGLILIKYTKVFWLALLGAIMMSISLDFLEVSVSAMTEPLYIFLMLLFLFLFFNYMERPHWALLISAALAASLAAMTRYAGIPLICTGIAGIFLCRNTSSGKIKHAVVFLLISLLPMVAWFCRNTFICGSIIDRPFVYHLSIVPDYFYKSATIFCGWFLSEKLPRVIKECVFVMGIVGFATVGVLLFKKRSRLPGSSNYSLLLVVLIFFYSAALMITVLFFDAYVEPSRKHFLPVYVPGVILCFGLMSLPLSSLKSDILKIGLVYLLAINSIKAIPCLKHLYLEGDGYRDKHWKESQTLSRIMSLPGTVPVYTNVAPPVYIFRGGPVFIIPCPVRPIMNKANNRYSEDLAEMGKKLKNGNGLLVYFNDVAENMFFEPVEKIEQRLPLQLITVYPDGRIYKIK